MEYLMGNLRDLQSICLLRVWQSVSQFSIFPRIITASSRLYQSHQTLGYICPHSLIYMIACPGEKEADFILVLFFCKIFTLLNKPTKAIESCGGLFWVSPSVARVQFSICPWPRRGDKYKVLANLIWQVWLGQPIWLGLCRGGECNREYRVWRAKINCIYHFWTKIGILLP